MKTKTYHWSCFQISVKPVSCWHWWSQPAQALRVWTKVSIMQTWKFMSIDANISGGLTAPVHFSVSSKKDSPPSPVPPLPERTPESFEMAIDKGITITGMMNRHQISSGHFVCTLSNLHLIFNRFGTKCDTGKTRCCNESWEIFRMVWANIWSSNRHETILVKEQGEQMQGSQQPRALFGYILLSVINKNNMRHNRLVFIISEPKT